MAEGRRADSGRRRQRVQQALDGATGKSERVSLSEFARRAGVDRSFVYRHGDLLAKFHALQAQPPGAPSVGPVVSRASLQADLLNAQQRALRLASRAQELEHRLSQALGEQLWRDSGIGLPDGTYQLEQRVVALEQEVVDLRLQLEERQQELDAARAANRELIARLNAPRAPR
ncbi:MAG: DUF6262 family protein [Acidimicrobiales bacterium]